VYVEDVYKNPDLFEKITQFAFPNVMVYSFKHGVHNECLIRKMKKCKNTSIENLIQCNKYIEE